MRAAGAETWAGWTSRSVRGSVAVTAPARPPPCAATAVSAATGAAAALDGTGDGTGSAARSASRSAADGRGLGHGLRHGLGHGLEGRRRRRVGVRVGRVGHGDAADVVGVRHALGRDPLAAAPADATAEADHEQQRENDRGHAQSAALPVAGTLTRMSWSAW